MRLLIFLHKPKLLSHWTFFAICKLIFLTSLTLRTAWNLVHWQNITAEAATDAAVWTGHHSGHVAVGGRLYSDLVARYLRDNPPCGDNCTDAPPQRDEMPESQSSAGMSRERRGQMRFKLVFGPEGVARIASFPQQPTWAELVARTAELASASPDALTLSYLDDEGDEITLSTDDELSQRIEELPVGQAVRFTVTITAPPAPPRVEPTLPDFGRGPHPHRRHSHSRDPPHRFPGGPGGPYYGHPAFNHPHHQPEPPFFDLARLPPPFPGAPENTTVDPSLADAFGFPPFLRAEDMYAPPGGRGCRSRRNGGPRSRSPSPGPWGDFPGSHGSWGAHPHGPRGGPPPPPSSGGSDERGEARGRDPQRGRKHSYSPHGPHERSDSEGEVDRAGRHGGEVYGPHPRPHGRHGRWGSPSPPGEGGVEAQWRDGSPRRRGGRHRSRGPHRGGHGHRHLHPRWSSPPPPPAEVETGLEAPPSEGEWQPPSSRHHRSRWGSPSHSSGEGEEGVEGRGRKLAEWDEGQMRGRHGRGRGHRHHHHGGPHSWEGFNPHFAPPHPPGPSGWGRRGPPELMGRLGETSVPAETAAESAKVGEGSLSGSEKGIGVEQVIVSRSENVV